MIVEQIWTGNAYRNFHYLIACRESGEALAIDPLDHEKCLACAKDNGWEITQILNTHEHPDHIGGNAAMIQATGAKLLAHEKAGPRIDGIDLGLSAGDVVRVGKTVELLALDTPGHTMSHICLLSKTDTPALFSGDTLFAAGAGNCNGGGDPEELFKTFVTQLARLTGRYTRLPWSRLHCQQPGLHRRSRARQRTCDGVAARGDAILRSSPAVWSRPWGWNGRSILFFDSPARH